MATIPTEFRLEPDSLTIYRDSGAGTPLIGIADLETGQVFIHPSAISFKKVEAGPAGSGYRFTASEYDIVKVMTYNPAGNGATARTRVFPLRAAEYFFQTSDYSAQQTPRVARLPDGQHVNYPDMDAYGFPADRLDALQHGARRGADVKTVVYHEMPGEVPQKKFLRRLHPNCGLHNALTSHDCVKVILYGGAWQSKKTLGFAVHRHQDNYCTTAEDHRIGPFRGMRFSGTSRSNNNRIFDNPADCQGCMSEDVAKLIFNAISAGVDPACALPRPCEAVAATAATVPADPAKPRFLSRIAPSTSSLSLS